MRLLGALLTGVIVASCGGEEPTRTPRTPPATTTPPVAAADAEVAPRPPREDRATPACEARYADGVIRVAGVPTTLRVAATSARELTAMKVASWPLDPERVLVATRRDWFVAGGASPDGMLWEVPCAAPRKAKIFLRRDGADFGHAAPSADGRSLFFGDRGGLAVLDIETRAVSPLTESPPVSADCWADIDGLRARDVVVGLSPDGSRLTFHRGGPCGFEQDWVAEELHLLDPMRPDARRIVRPRRLSALASDGRRLYLAEGGRCDEPGVVDPATKGGLWRSDGGAGGWEKRTFSADGGSRTHAARILTDPAKPGLVVVHMARCRVAEERPGGEVFVSEDAGVEWRRLDLPGEAEAAPAIEGLNERLEALVVWIGGQERYLTRDLGRTWTALSPRAWAAEDGRVAPVKLGGAIFAPAGGEVFKRSRPGVPPERVFPPPATPR